jgi:hypothetical protein
MRVQALVFGKPGSARFLDLTPRYRNLLDTQEAPLGARLRPPLDRAETDPAFLGRGVHLHWSLPAAFTHVRPSAEGGDAALPRVPDRWLVTRLWGTDAAPLARRSWVIESDVMDPRGDRDRSAPWLDEAQGRIAPTRLGRVTPLEGWTETQGDPGPTTGAGEGRAPLTGFAPGNPGFTGFYPACRGAFGFRDDCDDLPADVVCSYLVIGWFSDPDVDPLAVGAAAPGEAAMTAAERWAHRMARMRWDAGTDTGPPPTRTTCCGSIQGVRWTPGAACDAGDQPSVAVALGASLPEAAAALARGNGADAQRDRVASLAQLAALAERRATPTDLDDPGFFKQLGRLHGVRARLHEKGFAAIDGGAQWEIIAQEQAAAAPGEAAPPEPPQAVAAALRRLNAAERAHDAGLRARDGARARLITAWRQLQHWSIRAVGAATDDQKQALAAAVARARAEAEALAAALPALAAARAAAEGDLRALMLATASALQLVSRPAPRFWRPTDPFVLMAGLPAPAVQGGAAPLLCRVGDQTIGGLDGDFAVSRADLIKQLERLGVLPFAAPGLPPDCADLLVDAVFADPCGAGVLAAAYWQDRAVAPSAQQVARAKAAILKAQQRIGAAAAAVNGPARDGAAQGGGAQSGGAPAFDPAEVPLDGLAGPALRSALSAIRTHGAPPPPVFMAWEALWRPCAGPLAEGWDLSDRVDFDWRGPAPEGEGCRLDGMVLLATGLEQGLAATRKALDEPDVDFAYAGLAGLAGQGLAGLTEALGARDAGPQLRPLARDPATGALGPDPAMDGLVGDAHVPGPRPGDGATAPFAPLRGGEITLTRLQIVDSFGRVQDLLGPKGGAGAPAIGRALATDRPGVARLAPRLLQPARLRLDWLAARDDGEGDDDGDGDDSPVCGVIVHNRLDQNLLIYGAPTDADAAADAGAGAGGGRPLGAVQAIRLPLGREAVVWTSAPARPFAATPPGGLPTEADIPDPTLRRFVCGLIARFAEGGDGFKDFRALLAEHEDAADPAPDQGLAAILVGRPLLLVRAALSLELDGPPLADQSRAAVLEGGGDRDWGRRVMVPIRLGDRRLGPEGLVGWFRDDGGDAGFETLHLREDGRYSDRLRAHPYFAAPALTVAVDPDAPPVRLALLLDPKRPVHLVSGVLPAAAHSPPRGPVARALADMAFPFLAAPVIGELTDGDDPDERRALPTPSDGHDDWRWVWFPDRTADARDVPVSGDTSATPSLSGPMALHEGWLNYRPGKGKRT